MMGLEEDRLPRSDRCKPSPTRRSRELHLAARGAIGQLPIPLGIGHADIRPHTASVPRRARGVADHRTGLRESDQHIWDNYWHLYAE